MKCEFAHDDGAYVLGALSPAERDRYETHLATCAECRAALASLAVLPGLLGRLSPADAEKSASTESGSEQRLPNLLREVATSRRRQKVRLAAASLVAACLALFAGFAVGAAREPDPGVITIPVSPRPSAKPSVAMVAMQAVADTRVTAEVGLTQVYGGTVVTMRCKYPLFSPSPGASARPVRPYIFRLVALGPDGVSEQVGSWLAAPGDDMVVTGTVRLSIQDLNRLELRAKDGTALLAYDVP